MRLDVKGMHHLVGDFNARWIRCRDRMSLGGQTGLRLGIVDVAAYQVKGPKRTTRLGFADFAEQPMLNRVPF